MRRFIGNGLLGAVVTLVVTRVVAAFTEEWQRLVATGELARRIERRRTRRLVRVAVEAGIPPGPAPLGRPRVHAAVHAGRVPGTDVDDVGLLEASMRAAVGVDHVSPRTGRRLVEVRPEAAEPEPEPGAAPTPMPDPVPTPARTAAAPLANRPVMAATTDSTPQDPETMRSIRDAAARAADENLAHARTRTPTWTVGASALGVLVTLVPLIRPLGTVAPVFALLGLGLVLAAWFGVRRADRR